MQRPAKPRDGCDSRPRLQMLKNLLFEQVFFRRIFETTQISRRQPPVQLPLRSRFRFRCRRGRAVAAIYQVSRPLQKVGKRSHRLPCPRFNRAGFDPKQTFTLGHGNASNVNRTNDLRYQLEDFSNFDGVARSVASHSRNEKNRQSPMKQKKYTANCAMPLVGQKPALFINAIVQ
jgi:hypothetical protein